MVHNQERSPLKERDLYIGEIVPFERYLDFYYHLWFHRIKD